MFIIYYIEGKERMMVRQVLYAYIHTYIHTVKGAGEGLGIWSSDAIGLQFGTKLSVISSILDH